MIIEYEEGKFRKVSEASGWFYRVFEHPKDGLLLMGQRMGTDGLLEGAIYQMVWKKNRFERGSKMKFPSDAQLFGIATGHIRDPKDLDVIVLNEFNRLAVIAPDGKTVYTSRGHFGGTEIFYDTWASREMVYRPSDRISRRVFIRGRVLIRDLDKDGLDEVIVNKNDSSMEVMERAKTYDKGEIVDLVWDQGNLAQNWTTQELAGYITDYQIKDVDNDGEEELVVALVMPGAGLTGNPTSTILFFRF